MATNKILAGIVLFNPDLDVLLENVTAIKQQVDKVVLFNNGGQSLDLQAMGLGDIEYVENKNSRNVGIAKALNCICEYAFSNHFEWVLTLDQDSIVPSDLISQYSKYIEDSSIGLICPKIIDRNYGIDFSTEDGQDSTEYVDACITSASMLRLSSWKLIGGFWDSLFIDMVDFDLCWNLQRHGQKILKVNDVILFHAIGKGRKVKFRGKEEIVYNHQPIRLYYIIRNNILVGRKYNRLNQCKRWALRRFVLVMLFEPNKLKKLKLMIQGYMDGTSNKLGEYSELH